LPPSEKSERELGRDGLSGLSRQWRMASTTSLETAILAVMIVRHRLDEDRTENPV